MQIHNARGAASPKQGMSDRGIGEAILAFACLLAVADAKTSCTGISVGLQINGDVSGTSAAAAAICRPRLSTIVRAAKL
jgi:hypothetical protein